MGKTFLGWRVVACSVFAAAAATVMVQGCGGGDDSSGGGTATIDDGGVINLDSGLKIDATTTIADASACPSAQSLCGDACSTLSKDSQNCGACGNVCAAGEACSAGKCTTDCGGGQNLCGPGDAGDAGGSYCATFATDNANCGACGNQCPAGEMCSAGSCQTTCGVSQTACNVGNVADAGADAGHAGAPFCATLSTDDSNCGACGNACSAGESCTNGTCQVTCGASESLCSDSDAGTNGTDGGAAYCANFATDNANCGGCGTTCGAGQVCNGGTCGTTCEADLLQCGSKCIDPSTSITNCGATAPCDSDAGTAGVACPVGETCTAGACYPLVPVEIGHFAVSDGIWYAQDPPPPAYSCVQACAIIFGNQYTYGCSTDPSTLNHLTWGSNWGYSDHCFGGTPVADTYLNGAIYEQNPDATGSSEAPFSAYISDNCDDSSVNYCWILPP